MWQHPTWGDDDLPRGFEGTFQVGNRERRTSGMASGGNKGTEAKKVGLWEDSHRCDRSKGLVLGDAMW